MTRKVLMEKLAGALFSLGLSRWRMYVVVAKRASGKKSKQPGRQPHVPLSV